MDSKDSQTSNEGCSDSDVLTRPSPEARGEHPGLDSLPEDQLVRLHDAVSRQDHQSLWNLGNECLAKHERTHDIKHVEHAISIVSEAVSLATNSAPAEEQAKYLDRLGNLLWARYRALNELADIEQSIVSKQKAVDLTPNTHANKPAYLSNLGCSFQNCFERLERPHDVEKAIAVHLDAVNLTSDSDSRKPGRLSNLGTSFLSRYKLLGDLEDLEKAITAHQKAVYLAPDAHTEKPTWLNNLGSSLQSRFKRLGSLVDIEQSIVARQQAVNLTPDRNPNKPTFLTNLGNSLQSRFEQLGNLSDLEQSIVVKQQAVDLTADKHPLKPGLLSNIGISLHSHFQWTGNISDLDQSIADHQQAVNLTSDEDASMARFLSNLGVSLDSRFRRLNDIRDIEQSIVVKKKSVDLTPDGHAIKPSRLNNLGMSLRGRFGLVGNIKDLEQSILIQKQALDLTPDGHAKKPAWLSDLSITFLSRFEQSQDLGDIGQSITIQQQAVDLTRDDHAGKPLFLNNLGVSLRTRFEKLRDHNDVEQSIVAHRRAVDLAPDEYARTPGWLINLGKALQNRFDLLHEPLDMDKAISAYRAGAVSTFGAPSIVLKAARNWASTSIHNVKNPSLEAYTIVMSLIPRVVWLGTEISRRYEDITSLGDVVNEAAAAALSSQKFIMAVEWLEQGRSIVWGQILNLRDPMVAVQTLRPDLALELREVSAQLELAGVTSYLEPEPETTVLRPVIKQEEEAQNHRRLAGRYNELVALIRETPGLEDFLQSKKFSCLRDAAQYGPVVLVNIHISHCDALVIQKDHTQPLHVPLKSFSHAKAELLRRTLADALRRTHAPGRHSEEVDDAQGSPSDVLPTILAAIWTDVAKPVLDALRYTDRKITSPESDLELPHITWCLTGPLTFLPLHAAGLYDKPGEPKIYEYAVSSFTPSLIALLEACKRTSHKSPTVLAISQPSTPGQKSLHGTVSEVETIQRVIDPEHTQIVEWLNAEEATVAATTAAMKHHGWCHFACHGVQRTEDPIRSAFLLHDGELNLMTIMSSKFESAELAFLSACQTAKGDEKRPEESIHLAAGMLMAGYRTVFATMWSIEDKDAPLVAEEIYSYLLEERNLKRGEAEAEGRSSAAYALHRAVARLREVVGESLFVRWVPYIHIGV